MNTINDGVARPDYGLSMHQMRVLWLMACGSNNQEIARALGVTKNTACSYVTSIYSTLGIFDRVGVVIYAIMHNLVHVEDAYDVMAQKLDGAQ